MVPHLQAKRKRTGTEVRGRRAGKESRLSVQLGFLFSDDDSVLNTVVLFSDQDRLHRIVYPISVLRVEAL